MLGVAFFMTILDGTSLLAALPSLAAALAAPAGAIQWSVTAYALVFSGALLLCGRAADLFGRRRMFLAGMALRVAASLVCGLAPSIEVLVGARAVQGLSAAIIAPAALSMVVNAFPEGAERNRALGVWGGLGGFGATAGLLLGGLITDALGWQWVFWINVPVGVVVLALAAALLAESRDRTRARSLDLAGALTVTPALALLVYAITRVPFTGWASREVAAPLVAAAVLTRLFIRVERRSAAPLVPFAALRSPPLIGGNLLLLVGGMAVDGMLITLTAHVQQVLGWSAVRFGLAAAVMTVASIAGALVSQRLVTRLGPRTVAAAGTALIAGGCLLLVGLPSGGAIPFLVGGLLVFGAGMGATAVSGQIAALSGVAERHSGVAAGLADTSFAIGTALGVAVCASVAAARTAASVAGGEAAVVAGQRAAFVAAALIGALGLVVAFIMLGRRATAVRGPGDPAAARVEAGDGSRARVS